MTFGSAQDIDPKLPYPSIGGICHNSGMIMQSVLRSDLDPSPLRESYLSASPFPHAVIDDLFSPDLVDSLLAEFPDADGVEWKRFENRQERKLGYDYHSMLGDTLTRFMVFMSSPEMLEFLEKLTGIEGLIPDPYYGGAGPHQILPGGFLKIHADFNVHPKLRLDRRLNLLLYLNKDWEESYGGHLELWSTDMSHCVERILPVANRTVVFSTTSDSYHGHPDPLRCPTGRSRKSLSFYYYTNGRPEEEQGEAHDTLFKERFDGEWDKAER